MIEVAFSSSFKRAFRKRISGSPNMEARFWQKVDMFTQEPFDPQLRTHKLSGRLDGLWSFSIQYDVRVVFYFVDSARVLFVDVGTHDEVY